MESLDAKDAERRLADLLTQVAAGASFRITRDGRAIARLEPVRPAAPARRAGRLRGEVHVGDDFDAPLPQELARPFGMVLDPEDPEDPDRP